MASTYSTNLALELIATGEQSGTWGTTTNTNLGTLIEQAISGYVTQAITDGADTTITIPNGATGVARNMYIEMTGALTAARNLIVPANKKLYFIYNNTTGGFAVTVKVSGQTGVSVPNGTKYLLVVNGTDVVRATSYVDSTYLAVPLQFSGRLTLTSGTPVLTSDVTAATSVYFTPYNGNSIPVYDGTNSVQTTFSELTLALDSNSGHTGYHQSGKNFDLFVINDSGTIRLGTGPAWSSDTARGTGAGTTELELKNGYYTNKQSITIRFGSASGNTVVVAANRATYVGTFRASADGQTQWKLGSSAAGGGEAWLGLWSMYNRVTVCPSVQDTVDSYTYQSTTIRSMNNSATNRISFIQGLAEDGIIVNKKQLTLNSATDSAYLGVSLDATDSYTDGLSQASTAADAGGTAIASMVRSSLLGWHFAQAVESCSSATNACTFYGDAGGAITKTIMAGSLRM